MADQETTNNTWYLKGDDETIYGPVDAGTLEAWCLEGRIEPDHALSEDGETWIDAASVPLLGMDWIAILEDGSKLGPFNLAIVPDLIQNAIIPLHATLENRHTGESRSATKLAPASTAHASDQPETAVTTTDPTPDSAAPELDDASSPESSLPLEADNEPLSSRLEPLQRSATEARQQLAETRRNLQSIKTQYTVLEDDNQRLKSELSAAQFALEASEKQLLEQQDRAAAAETEIENLSAQLEQLKDHYDSLQLENQNQFERIDTLQATQLENEQRFKRELTEWRDRADIKTELLTGTVQLLMRDADIAKRLKSLATVDAQQHEQQKSTIKQLEQQLVEARKQAQQTTPANRPASNAPARFKIVLLILIGMLTGSILTGVFWHSRNARPSPMETTLHAEPSAQQENETDTLSLESAGTLDLQPEENTLHDANTVGATRSTANDWPTLSLPAATIQQDDHGLRIIFNEGLFSAATRLTPDAQTQLRALADQLKGNLQGYQLMIEGHTDATPIAAAGSRYVDNFALGMARASAVMTFLEQVGGVPAESMRTSSAGESTPPFSNETEADRRRNRTAVLTLIPTPSR